LIEKFLSRCFILTLLIIFACEKQSVAAKINGNKTETVSFIIFTDTRRQSIPYQTGLFRAFSQKFRYRFDNIFKFFFFQNADTLVYQTFVSREKFVRS